MTVTTAQFITSEMRTQKTRNQFWPSTGTSPLSVDVYSADVYESSSRNRQTAKKDMQNSYGSDHFSRGAFILSTPRQLGEFTRLPDQAGANRTFELWLDDQ